MVTQPTRTEMELHTPTKGSGPGINGEPTLLGPKDLREKRCGACKGRKGQPPESVAEANRGARLEANPLANRTRRDEKNSSSARSQQAQVGLERRHESVGGEEQISEITKVSSGSTAVGAGPFLKRVFQSQRVCSYVQ